MRLARLHEFAEFAFQGIVHGAARRRQQAWRVIVMLNFTLLGLD
jgi:hypothetical protein